MAFNFVVWLCAITVGFAMLFVAGCGRKEIPRVPVVPVSGKILVDGRAAKKAQLIFHRQGGAATSLGRPFAIAGDDGSFKPTTYLADDGLPSGDYLVTVIWPTVSMQFGEEVTGLDQLNGKYQEVQNAAGKVTVGDSPVVMPPLELKTR